MSFIHFIKTLELQLQNSLPGDIAHLELTSMRRMREMLKDQDFTKYRKSAVLILLYPDEKERINTILIQRPTYDGVHSGQIGLPGGKYEHFDNNLINTALRESSEEVGIDPENVKIIGCLTELYIPPSRMSVLPVIGYQNTIPSMIPDPSEVEKIIIIQLEQLLEPAHFQKRRVSVADWSEEVPCFYIDHNLIWGATAMILNELKTIIRTIPLFRSNG